MSLQVVKSPKGSRSLSLSRTAFDLPNPLVTRHLDPGLARHPKSLTFRIDLAEQVERKVDIHALFGAMLPGEICRDVFPSFSAFRDLFDLYPFSGRMLNRFLGHKFVSLLLLSATL